MSVGNWSSYRGKRVLLLQGPVGPYFGRLRRVLRSVGAEVHKVNFNGGDLLFYPLGATNWRGTLNDWPAFLEGLLDRLHIDVVMLFGDCRPIHRIARDVAHRCGIKVGVFEEGYVRPNFVTFEHSGVNGHSLIPRNPDFYRGRPFRSSAAENPVRHAFAFAALWASLYYCASSLLYFPFSHYQHHRRLSILEAMPWWRAGWRKIFYRWTERKMLSALTGVLSKRYFLVPLQAAEDYQVRQHSTFDSIEDFIRATVSSFAANAPPETVLVIKHHPLDRGYCDYCQLISRLTTGSDLQGRVFYIHDQHLPTLFEYMRGAVVINSTVGFSALSHGAPVKTCGLAIYDMEGLTFQGSVDDFWVEAAAFRPDMDLHRLFRSHLIDATQINGKFYRGQPDAVGQSTIAQGAPPEPLRAPRLLSVPNSDPAARVANA